MLFGAVADFVDHRLRHCRARSEDETRAFDRIDFARRVVDFVTERVRERVIQREARPRRDVHLFVLRVHCVFRQRLEVLPAAEGAQATEIRAGEHGEVAAVSFAVNGAFRVGRAQLRRLAMVSPSGPTIHCAI